LWAHGRILRFWNLLFFAINIPKKEKYVREIITKVLFTPEDGRLCKGLALGLGDRFWRTYRIWYVVLDHELGIRMGMLAYMGGRFSLRFHCTVLLAL
jgi:hypothetical protein